MRRPLRWRLSALRSSDRRRFSVSAAAVATFSLVRQRWLAQSGPMKPSCPRRLPPPQHCAHAVRPDPRQSLHHDGHTPRVSTVRSPFSRPAPSQRAQRARPAPPHALQALPRAAVMSGSASTTGGCCGRTRTRAAGGGGLLACTTVCVATDSKPSRKPADAASTTVSIMAQLRSSQLRSACASALLRAYHAAAVVERGCCF